MLAKCVEYATKHLLKEIESQSDEKYPNYFLAYLFQIVVAKKNADDFVLILVE